MYPKFRKLWIEYKQEKQQWKPPWTSVFMRDMYPPYPTALKVKLWPQMLLDWNSSLLLLVRYWLMFLNQVCKISQLKPRNSIRKRENSKILENYFLICFRTLHIFWCMKKLVWKNMETKLHITLNILISNKYVIDEKYLRIVFYIRIHIQKYQNLILC